MLDQSDPVQLELLKTRVAMLMREPLFGQLIMHLDFEDATAWCPTAATDGRKLYYNRNYVQSLSRPQLIFLLCHEVRHVLLDHIGRRGVRDRDIWNMASDFIANHGLVRDGIGEMPPNGLYDDNYSDAYSVEELYELLISKGVKVQMTLDLHLDLAGPDSESPDSDQGRVKLDVAALDEGHSDMLAALRRAVSGGGVGDLSVGLRRLLNQLTSSQIDWRQILNASLRSMVKYDYTYARPSRRGHVTDLLLPGQDAVAHLAIVCAIDASASTSAEMVTDFLSEIGGIMASFNDYVITVLCFDTKVYNVRTFTPQNAPDLAHYPLVGGGGTAPSCCWSYLQEHHLRPERLLVFTDGLVGDDWGEPDYVPTIFVIHSNPTITASHGLTCHFEFGR